jgi:uncharacterized membrane protein YphA (DoxX/SURF4 family)
MVFVVAGAQKLADPAALAEIIARYHLVPAVLVPQVAWGLPILEVVAGLGLVADLRWSLGAVSGMLALFALVLYYGALQGLDIDCGCFSSRELAEHGSLWMALYRDLVMLAGAVFLYLWRRLGRSRLARRGWRYRLQLAKEEL